MALIVSSLRLSNVFALTVMLSLPAPAFSAETILEELRNSLFESANDALRAANTEQASLLAPTYYSEGAANYRKADLTFKQMAMLDFAMKVSNNLKCISDSDFEVLRGHGFTDEDIWDIAGIAALLEGEVTFARFLADLFADRFAHLLEVVVVHLLDLAQPVVGEFF